MLFLERERHQSTGIIPGIVHSRSTSTSTTSRWAALPWPSSFPTRFTTSDSSPIMPSTSWEAWTVKVSQPRHTYIHTLSFEHWSSQPHQAMWVSFYIWQGRAASSPMMLWGLMRGWATAPRAQARPWSSPSWTTSLSPPARSCFPLRWGGAQRRGPLEPSLSLSL